MTYENRYRVVFEGETVRDLTLYEACKLVANDPRGLQDAAHVKRADRVVCFFSVYHQAVRAMWGANDEERTVVGAWAS